MGDIKNNFLRELLVINNNMPLTNAFFYRYLGFEAKQNTRKRLIEALDQGNIIVKDFLTAMGAINLKV